MYPDRNVIMAIPLVCLSEYGDAKGDLHEMPALVISHSPHQPEIRGNMGFWFRNKEVTSETKVETCLVIDKRIGRCGFSNFP